MSDQQEQDDEEEKSPPKNSKDSKESNKNKKGKGDILELDAKTSLVFAKKGYTISKKLNAGAFGEVYKGMLKDSPESKGIDVAIKVMFVKKLGQKYEKKFWPRELAALINVRHKHIIRVYDIIKCAGKLFIFMEFANGGDITGYLKEHKAPIPEPIACYWFAQCLSAMAYMHDEQRFAHRDIKIDNVLLDGNIAKVTDFGFAKHIPQGESPISKTHCGTAPYYSPQLVKRVPYDVFAADCWAMGVMMFAMLNNKYPYHFKDKKKFYKEQVDPEHIHGRYVKKFPEDLRELQETFFIEDEAERQTMSNALQHPWIQRKGK